MEWVLHLDRGLYGGWGGKREISLKTFGIAISNLPFFVPNLNRDPTNVAPSCVYWPWQYFPFTLVFMYKSCHFKLCTSQSQDNCQAQSKSHIRHWTFELNVWLYIYVYIWAIIGVDECPILLVNFQHDLVGLIYILLSSLGPVRILFLFPLSHTLPIWEGKQKKRNAGKIFCNLFSLVV